MNKELKLLKKEERKAELIEVYVKLFKKHNFYPSLGTMAVNGYNRDDIRRIIGNIHNLRIAAKEAHPEVFKYVLDDSHFSNETHESNLAKIRKYRRFVITSAVNGCKVNKDFYNSIQSYCRRNKALLIVLPSFGTKNRPDNRLDWHFDKELLGEIIAFGNISLNDNIHIESIAINAEQVNPVSGLERLGQGSGSFILGSPKQSLEYVPLSESNYPHAIMSTGALTDPDYMSSKFLVKKRARLSTYDHVLGAIIVEIKDKEEYHFRQIQADDKGGFADLGKYYQGNKVKALRPDVVFGDWHAGETDPSAKKAWIELIKHTNARNGYFHDLFSGISINHHEQHKKVSLARKAMEGYLNLEAEGDCVAKELNDMGRYLEELYVVPSNHDEFLSRYLEEGRHEKDPYNYKTGCELVLAMLNNQYPLKVLVEKYVYHAINKRIKWLKRDVDHRVGGVELGAHGDKGPNGSRGSKRALEKTYHRAVIGHSHTPGILRGIFQVGTTSKLDLEYAVGPSSWMHTSALVYPNGQIQLINSIKGKWHLK